MTNIWFVMNCEYGEGGDFIIQSCWVATQKKLLMLLKNIYLMQYSSTPWICRCPHNLKKYIIYFTIIRNYNLFK